MILQVRITLVLSWTLWMCRSTLHRLTRSRELTQDSLVGLQASWHSMLCLLVLSLLAASVVLTKRIFLHRVTTPQRVRLEDNPIWIAPEPLLCSLSSALIMEPPRSF